MTQVWFRFYEELNDFLPACKRKTSFAYFFKGNPVVKAAIEHLGIPHVEIDLILVNGNPVDFTYRIKNEDKITVYPVFERLDISGISPLREKPLRETKFILDVHLGKLSRYLRLLGFDTVFETGYTDREIIDRSLNEQRIILTRDRDLLKTKRVTHGCWIRSPKPKDQLQEILKRLDLIGRFNPFTRCMDCNGILEDIVMEEVPKTLPPKTRQFFRKFIKCTGCGKIYWEGSHYEKMKAFIESIVSGNQ
jgi:uncharacterized protein with PIN domain